MTKEEKRNYNYQKFCSKLETNMFIGKYIAENKDKTKILTHHVFKNNNIDNEIIDI